MMIAIRFAFCFCFLSLLTLPARVSSHDFDQKCGTPTKSAEERATVNAEVAAWYADHGCKESGLDCLATIQAARSAEATHTIDTYWHIIRDNSGTTGVSTQDVTNSMTVLNEAFSRLNVGYQFVLKDTTTNNNDDWNYNTNIYANEEAMKAATRVGDCGVLNIWSTLDSVAGAWATVAADCAGNMTVDGVVINSGTVPGGGPGREGDLLIHEVGHWLGLEHPFLNGCTNPNDSVDDTPQMMNVEGCPTLGSSDTCPDDPGTDPTDNYMSYVDDACMINFTPGQITRMIAQGTLYRGFPDPTAATPTPAPAPNNCFALVDSLRKGLNTFVQWWD